MVLVHIGRARPTWASSSPSITECPRVHGRLQAARSSCLTLELTRSAAHTTTGPGTGRAFCPAPLTHRAALQPAASNPNGPSHQLCAQRLTVLRCAAQWTHPPKEKTQISQFARITLEDRT